MWSLTPATTCRWNDWFKMPESEVERQEQLSLLHVLPIPSAGNNMKKKLVLARKNRLRLEGSRFDCNWILKLMHEESDSLSSFFVLIPSSSCIDYIFDLRDRPLLEARNCLIKMFSISKQSAIQFAFSSLLALAIGCLDAMPTGLTLEPWPLSFVWAIEPPDCLVSSASLVEVCKQFPKAFRQILTAELWKEAPTSDVPVLQVARSDLASRASIDYHFVQ